MADYLRWDQTTITDFSDENINAMYSRGYVFTRVDKGVMDQTRSLRIDLDEFKLSSENRRILRKTKSLKITNDKLPMTNYHWSIGKMAKDFYDKKFGKGTFSANKVKELLTTDKSNFNRLFVYTLSLREANEMSDEAIPSKQDSPEIATLSASLQARNDSEPVGHCIARETNELVHYSYPFYQLPITNYQLPNVGMGMMLRAILYAKEKNKKYIYLGSFQRPGDTYKLQFAGLEWFDGESWSDDLEELKDEL